MVDLKSATSFFTKSVSGLSAVIRFISTEDFLPVVLLNTAVNIKHKYRKKGRDNINYSEYQQFQNAVNNLRCNNFTGKSADFYRDACEIIDILSAKGYVGKHFSEMMIVLGKCAKPFEPDCDTFQT